MSLIVKHKYLKNRYVEEWLRIQVFNIQGTSYIWNGFIRALSWITRCLGWKVGNGQSIRIGIDPIASLNLDFVLPEDLGIYLEYYGATTLADAHYWGSGSFAH